MKSFYIFVALIWYAIKGNDDCKTEKTPISQEDLDQCVNPAAYAECIYKHSNIADVKKFASSEVAKLPEEVFCAYRCMAQRCGLLLENGLLNVDKWKDFPALQKNYNWSDDYVELSNECFERHKDDEIKYCYQFQTPMMCFDVRAIVGYVDDFMTTSIPKWQTI